jgi:hypothetical protein
VHEGRATLVLPARDADPRLARRELRVRSTDLDVTETVGAAAPAAIDASEAVAIVGRVSAPIATLHTRGSDARVFAVAPRVVATHDVILAIDLSPSMEEVPEGRLEQALQAVLDALPRDARVRAMRFGAHAEWVSADGALPPWQPPSAFDARVLIAPGWGALGARTLYAPIAARVDEALDDALSPVVIVIGDGALVGADFDAVVREGGRIVVADVGDAPFSRELEAAAQRTPTTLALSVGASLAGRDGTPASAIVAEPCGPFVIAEGRVTTSYVLPSGEALTHEALAPISLTALARPVPRAAAPWSALPHALGPGALAVDPRVWGDVAKLDGGGPAPRRVPGGLGGVDDAVTGAPYIPSAADVHSARRLVAAPLVRAASVEIRAIPSSATLRRAVMRSLRPRVQGCFAEARAGRWGWWAHADVRLLLGHREVLAGTVTGANVSESLAACIERGFEHIQVPRTDELVLVHFPFVAAPVPRPPRVPLAPATDAALQAALGRPDPALDAEARALVAGPAPAPL